jgi:hypothetical protein
MAALRFDRSTPESEVACNQVLHIRIVPDRCENAASQFADIAWPRVASDAVYRVGFDPPVQCAGTPAFCISDEAVNQFVDVLRTVA